MNVEPMCNNYRTLRRIYWILTQGPPAGVLSEQVVSKDVKERFLKESQQGKEEKLRLSINYL